MTELHPTLSNIKSSDEDELGVYKLADIDNKKRLFQKVAELLSEKSDTAFHTILDGLNSREKMGKTYIGNGVAIPHCKLEVEHPSLIVLQLDEPIQYSDNRQEQVDIVFALLVPSEKCDDHIYILSSIAKLCEQQSWLEHFRSLSTSEDMYNYLKETNSKLNELL